MLLPRAEDRRDDVEVGRPLALRLDPRLERQPLLVHAGRRRCRDVRPTLKGLALVPQHEPAVGYASRVGPFLLQRVLDLEEVGEVGARIDPNGQVDRFLVVVENLELLTKPVSDRTASDDGELRIDVDGPRPGNQEETCLEVLQVVGRQRCQPFPIHRQDPLREEAGVEGEQARRVGQRRLDVPSGIADHESIAVEDLDEPVAHALRRPPAPFRLRLRLGGGPGKSFCSCTNSSISPSIVTAPRNTAAAALTSPSTIRSNNTLSVRRVQSAPAFRRDTARSPLSTTSSQRSVRFPSTSSNRTVPFAFSSIGTCPRWVSEPKNSAVASLIVPRPSSLDSDPGFALVRHSGACP